MKAEDYTIEYCPYCDQEVAIRSHGITTCPSCSKRLLLVLCVPLSAMVVCSLPRVRMDAKEEQRVSDPTPCYVVRVSKGGAFSEVCSVEPCSLGLAYTASIL